METLPDSIDPLYVVALVEGEYNGRRYTHAIHFPVDNIRQARAAIANLMNDPTVDRVFGCPYYQSDFDRARSRLHEAYKRSDCEGLLSYRNLAFMTHAMTADSKAVGSSLGGVRRI